MSLINRMLQDLDNRQGSAPGADDALPAGLLDSSAPQVGSNTPVGWVLIFLIICITLVGVAYMKKKMPSAPLPESAPIAPQPPTSIAGADQRPAQAGKSLPEAPPSLAEPTPGRTAAPVTPAATSIAAPVENHAAVREMAKANAPVVANSESVKSKKEKTLRNERPTELKAVSPQQRAQHLFQLAASAAARDHSTEAQSLLRNAIGLDPGNTASRQLLATLLMDAGRNGEALTLLSEGLQNSPDSIELGISLARLQVAMNLVEDAARTIESVLRQVPNHPELNAFLATVRQKQGEHEQAVQHYMKALASNPMMPQWLVGIGISLQATGRPRDAQAAYQRALETGQLSPDLVAYAQQRLVQLRAQ